MMSTVVEVVDEGLGEDFEDTPWIPPTVKRVGFEIAGFFVFQNARGENNGTENHDS